MLVHYRKMNILLVCMIVLTATAYDLTCPHLGHWETRAIAKCNSTEKYVCLWEENEEYYLERCIGPKQDWKGYRYVLNNGNFNRRRCASTQFQPFQFGTYGNSGCAMKKSLCNDEGQIFEYDGNSILDRRCRCDYTEGYAFVSDTKNPCYCIPSNEDCSCYKKNCGKEEILSQDYYCIDKTTLIQRKPKCSSLEENQFSRPKSDVVIPITRNSEGNTHNLPVPGPVLMVFAGMIVILLMIPMLLLIATTWCVRHIGVSVIVKTRFSKEERHKFEELIQKKNETRYSIRVMIVGKNGAGKTSLLQRLLGKSIESVTSTDGIDISLARCKIRRRDGKLILNEERMDSNKREDEEFIECTFWDFAGEKDYYVTHQVFLNPYCVYLLVASLTDDVESVPTGVTYDSIGDHVEFWFDNIQLYAAQDGVCPPVLFVSTNTDSYKTQNELKARTDQYRRRIFDIRKHENRKNLESIIHLSNTDSPVDDFEELRKSIFQLGKNIKTFADKVPLHWNSLEKSLAVEKEMGTNVMSISDMISLAVDNSLEKTEVSIFLKYQHNLGNLFYFERFPEFVILSHQWLADAFTCLVSVKINDQIKCSEDWRVLEKNGLLHDRLISKLFTKVDKLEFNKYQDHLLNIMEMFDIVVKPSLTSSYYMPSMIVESAPSVDEILKICNIKQNMRSPWLCLQFTFLPISIFNHVYVYYIRQYKVATVFTDNIERLAIYHGMGIFYFDPYIRLILAFSKNKICIQLWTVSGNPGQETYEQVLEELLKVIKNIGEQYALHTNLTITAMCSSGNIYSTAGQVSSDDIHGHGEYVCKEHGELHSSKPLLETWLPIKDVTYRVSCRRKTDNCHVIKAHTTGRMKIESKCTERRKIKSMT